MAQREHRRGGVAFQQQQQQQQQHQHQQWQAKGSTSTTTTTTTIAAASAASSGSPGKFRNHQQPQLHHHHDYDGSASGSSSSSSMRDPLSRTKAVVRRLPPTLSKEAFVTQIDAKYAGTYSWLSYHCGKSSSRKQVQSRAYLDFKHPEDVLAFHEGFDGHVFVSEKGAQFKAAVEYAPCQRVPDPRLRRDTRDGTIYKDPDYVAFCEMLAKPVELLPSAEVQLERREVERQGATKEPVVTPLMEYVRKNRAIHQKPGVQRSRNYRSGGQNYSRRKTGSGEGTSNSRREGGRRRNDFRRREATDNGTMMQSEEASQAGGSEPLDEGSRRDYSKRKLLQRERNHFQEGSSSQAAYAPRNRPPASPKAYNYRERQPRGKEPEPQAEKKMNKQQQQRSESEMNAPDDGRRARRPDRQYWTVRRRLDTVQEADEAQAGKGRDTEPEVGPDGRNGGFENGIHKYGAKKGPKDGDDASRHGKKPATPSEKQIWVQKSGSAP